MQFRSMTTDPAQGHRGHRRWVNYEILATDPSTKATCGFVFKDQDIDFKARPDASARPDEIEKTLESRRALKQVETPIGYWSDYLGHVYAIFSRIKGHTLLMEPRTNFRPLLKAAQYYGKLFQADILHQDTGIQHVFVTIRQKVRLFDFEAQVSNPDPRKKDMDFGLLVATAAGDHRIRTVSQIDQMIEQFLEGSGIPKNRQTPEEKNAWKKTILRYLEIHRDKLGLDLSSAHDRAKRFALMRSLVNLNRLIFAMDPSRRRIRRQ